MNDRCETKPLIGSYVQENGLIRNFKGELIGRLCEDVNYDSDSIVSDGGDTSEAMDTLRKAFKDDPGYAHSWHCNIAMMHYGAMADSGYTDHDSRHRTANDGASRFMKLCFDVETSATGCTDEIVCGD